MISRVCPKGNLTVSDFGKDIKRFMSNLSRSFFMLLSLMIGLTWQFNAFAQELDYADESGKAAEIIKNSEQYQAFLKLQKKIAEENGDRVRKFEVYVDGINSKIYPAKGLVSQSGYYAFPRINVHNESIIGNLTSGNDLVLLNARGDIEYINLTPKYDYEIENIFEIISEKNSIKGLSFKKVLFDNKVLDLRGFNKLKYLRLNDTNYEEIIFPIDNAITSLELFFSPIRKLKGIEKLAELENINLRLVNLMSLDGIENSKRLLRLEIGKSMNSDFYISELPHLKAFKDLEFLSFNAKYLKNVEGIDDLHNLKRLSVGKDFNYTGLDFPDSLEILYLRGKNNTEMPNLSGNTKLKKLFLSGTSVKRIEGLDELVNLEELYFVKNEVGEISDLEKLKKLKKLNLSGNNIENIENIEELNSLEELDLSYNMIESTKGLSKNLNLKRVNLEKNKIKKVEDVNNLTNLIVLDLVFNPIEEFDYSSVNNLMNTKIRLSDTPVGDAMTKAEKKKYRKLNRMLFF